MDTNYCINDAIPKHVMIKEVIRLAIFEATKKNASQCFYTIFVMNGLESLIYERLETFNDRKASTAPECFTTALKM